ncbi:MAG: cadherin repeat domain-containing protein [Flavobacteriaceae bacterium]|nr:cadherin repeat domain-containing protein [Flavobacteriaceae bacterium]
MVTAPTGYEISLTSGGTFSSSITLTQTASTVGATTIYVRLKSDASNGVSGNISCTSTNAATQTVSTGTATVNNLPTVTLSNSANTVTYDANSQTTTISYSNTTGNPTTYSITWNANPSNSFSTVTNANLSSSPININVPAGANTGTYTGTLTVRNAIGCTSINNNFTFTIAINNGDVTSPIITHPITQNNLATSAIKISDNITTVTTFTANENVTWSITGGSDANLFTINSNTGVLSFISPPDYDNPQDTIPYNSYIVEVTATDGSLNFTRRTLTVTISPFCGYWGN